ncbi:Translocon-associated protein subunit alpha like [Actinidia chinensis var. chinensis]|uniref:Translocon-associated protein subunit alpha n=1 Tax=Actinidia chinensis var. chinensis TaxID=1590841 RepID=A0A2R6QQ75_ACTCC|nr:Translocon-associated protein subunit alpha like [Actinidia chinensis var. chinensis]
MKIRVFYILALLLLSSPFLKVARCQSDSDVEFAEVAEESIEGGDLGIIGEDVQDFGDGSFSPAPGVETVCVFPKNPSRSVVAGEESELLVGMKNEGELGVNVIAIKASVHLPYDHRMLVQNLTAQAFNNASVPPSAQATFPYIFAVSKFLQAGTFDLVGTIVYEIDQFPYQSTFYNGTFEVTEAGGPLSVESVFLFCLGISLLGLLGLWIRGQIQHLSKKTKRAPKVEVGTKTTDASMDEWLQGTAYTQSLSSKSKKKK